MLLVVAAGSCSSSHDEGTASVDPSPPAPPSAPSATPEPSSPAPAPAPGADPSGVDATYPPLFVGRFDTTDPAGPKASWPGSRILARFEGTAVSVKLSESAETWMEGAPSYWEVTIDHGPWTPIAMIADRMPHDFTLASGLPKGPHEVEIYKRSETQTGTTQFLGFDFHGGKSLPPPARQVRKIEVMGDSFATGFGVEKIDAPGTDCPGVDWSGAYENFRKSWGAILGVMFDAEVHGIVYSGKGLIKNVWPTDNDGLRDYYGRVNPDPEIAASAPLFDLKSWVPDVIVLTQGSCDFDGGIGGAEFEAAYRDFVVNRLRARGPSTHIFMGVVGAGARGPVSAVANSIIAERAAVGDHNMHAFLAKPYTWDEMTACNGHGTPAWHQRVALEIAAEIEAKVGWTKQ
jgi:hypothetical protein